MDTGSVRRYVAVVVFLSLGSLLLPDWASLFAFPAEAWTGLFALVALGLLSESLSLTIKVGGNSGSSSITFLPLLACVLLFGPAPALILHATTGSFGELIIRRKSPLKATFNISQFVLSTVVGGLVFTVVGGLPQAPELTGGDFAFQLGPVVAFGLVFLLINHGSVSIAIALSQRMSFRKAWELLAGKSGTNLLSDLLVSPISLVIAFLYVDYGIPGFLIVLLPLLFIRRAYLTMFELQQANTNLLRALVTAIEVRDPYTSGHSQRVADLSRRIAERLGFSTRQVKLVETAALLHDIGKIDEMYLQILKKNGPLTSAERRVIESHVTRGVALLESFSSFPEVVLEAVRHHHERVDGLGYPSGAKGDAIPIGGRIIKVSDAIDAMLSDRAYRKALTLASVREQLLEFAGIQFDQSIVAVVMRSSLLDDHAAEIGRSPVAEPLHLSARQPASRPSEPVNGSETLSVIN